MLSDKVPYFILDLLQQAPSVFVEGLGRFEAIFHPAVIDLPEARIKPPYVEPDFKYDLDNPSEILSKYIAYAAGTQVGIANGAIVAFVRRVFEQTENGMMYPIEKFGTFSRSATGHIRFTPDWDAFNLSFSGLEVLDISPARETSNGSEVYFPPPPPPIVEKWIEPEVSETIATHNYDFESKPTESVVETPVAPVEEITSHQSQIEQSTSRLWWIILTSAIVLIAIMCAYLAWDIISNRQKLEELKALTPDTTKLQDTLAVVDTITNPVQETPVTPVPDPVVEPTTPTPADTKPSGSNCYVVVGAFTDQSNVTKMVDRLVSLGYTAEQIQGGSLTRVAIRTDCEPANLQKILNDARSAINPEAWIY